VIAPSAGRKPGSPYIKFALQHKTCVSHKKNVLQ
jgi:hypothetical protein